MNSTSSSILPSKETFRDALLNRGVYIPIYLELPFKEPASVFGSLCSSKGILLESMKGPEAISRYSFIIPAPLMELRLKNGIMKISFKDEGNKTLALDLNRMGKRPLTFLMELMSHYPQQSSRRLPPFMGGLVGLVSYDFVHYLERLPCTVTDDQEIPDIHFYLTGTLLAFDHIERTAHAVSAPGAMEIFKTLCKKMEKGESVSQRLSLPMDEVNPAYERAVESVIHLSEQYRLVPESTDFSLPRKKRSLDICYETGRVEYVEIVNRAKNYIHQGDIFQANLSQRISADMVGRDPFRLYSILRKINPSPFAFYADFGDYQIASSSPERLVRLRADIAETRPIAGTRPRGLTRTDDNRLRADLLLNEKERAEHIMLIDLERNDLGKVCRYGTVEVNELMVTESYSHVIHIVSNVRGVIAPGRNAFSLLRAAFPGGTITGVPKVRCMEIIDELEKTARGPYTGSFGYIGFTGDMDINIIIRTFLIKGDTAFVQAGAGIVADSEPEREYLETLKKAEALLSALERL